MYVLKLASTCVPTAFPSVTPYSSGIRLLLKSSAYDLAATFKLSMLSGSCTALLAGGFVAVGVARGYRCQLADGSSSSYRPRGSAAPRPASVLDLCCLKEACRYRELGAGGWASANQGAAPPPGPPRAGALVRAIRSVTPCAPYARTSTPDRSAWVFKRRPHPDTGLTAQESSEEPDDCAQKISAFGGPR